MSVNNMSSMLRISGISSGLDTASMVQSLMKIEQLRVDQVMRQKIKMEWAKEARTDVNKKLTDLRNSYASVLSPTNLNSPSAFKANKVEMITNSNAVSITVNSDANVGSYTINSISQLASAATAESDGRVSASALNRNTALKDLALDTALEFDENDEISFKINDETFTFKNTDSLGKMMTTINNSEAGVTMTYSAISGGFKLESKTIGAGSEMTLENISGNAFGNSAGEVNAFGITAESIQAGKNAILSINGYDVEQTSNRFTLDGITFNLIAETDTPVMFKISQDIDSVVDKIKSFVEDYNKVIDELSGKLSEKINYNYEPLTDEQKEAMTEKEIEKWEDLAKSGLMRNDRQLNNMLSTMRSAIYESVEGVGKSLFDVGIKTGSWMEGGKLVIDENKLRTALSNNPDEVAAIFTQTSTSSNPATKRAETGFMPKIAAAISEYTSSYNSIKATEDIGKVASRIAQLQEAMYAKEETYWARFTSMETALGTLNSQSSWLTQQLALW